MTLQTWDLLWTKYLQWIPGLTLGKLQEMKDLGILDIYLQGIRYDENKEWV